VTDGLRWIGNQNSVGCAISQNGQAQVAATAVSKKDVGDCPIDAAGVPVHQITPTASGQHRSGRTGLTPDQ